LRRTHCFASSSHFFFCVKSSSSFNTTSHPFRVKKKWYVLRRILARWIVSSAIRALASVSRVRVRAFFSRARMEREKKNSGFGHCFSPHSRGKARVKFFLFRGLCEMCSNASASFGPRAVGKYANVVLPSNARSVWAFGISRAVVSGAETCAHFSLVFSRSPNLCLFVVFLPRRVPKHSR
jgi:hypothetical protein